MSKIEDSLIVTPGKRVKLSKVDAGATPGGKDKQQAEPRFQMHRDRLAVLQYLLYAENKRSVLIVLQGIDAAGKDGTIRHVMAGLNPQGCRVTAFKAPAGEEAQHYYLWRVHKDIPSFGQVGIFNRSHYEDVLIVRVHNLVSKAVWSRRYDQINAFEHTLTENGVTILKFFLYISKDEQLKRFEERLQDPQKTWKFSLADVEERKSWDNYIDAFDDALTKCSTDWAPWYIIPANKKWYRNLAVAEIIVKKMEEMKMQLPKPAIDPAAIKFE